jgi:hypothetical protein
MKKYPLASTYTLCMQGALLVAVRMLHKGKDDEAIIRRIDEVYSCGTREQYLDIIRLARQGIRAADLLVELNPDQRIDTILIPKIPR